MNGFINNTPAPQESYVWKIQLTKAVNGVDSFEKTGTVTLIR